MGGKRVGGIRVRPPGKTAAKTIGTVADDDDDDTIDFGPPDDIEPTSIKQQATKTKQQVGKLRQGALKMEEPY
jgi:hypothetical protein